LAAVGIRASRPRNRCGRWHAEVAARRLAELSVHIVKHALGPAHGEAHALIDGGSFSGPPRLSDDCIRPWYNRGFRDLQTRNSGTTTADATQKLIPIHRDLPRPKSQILRQSCLADSAALVSAHSRDRFIGAMNGMSWKFHGSSQRDFGMASMALSQRRGKSICRRSGHGKSIRFSTSYDPLASAQRHSSAHHRDVRMPNTSLVGKVRMVPLVAATNCTFFL
jgi:hypothetical protein